MRKIVTVCAIICAAFSVYAGANLYSSNREAARIAKIKELDEKIDSSLAYAEDHQDDQKTLDAISTVVKYYRYEKEKLEADK